VVELVVIVAMAVGLALGIQAFLVKPYQIPSESMEPTLDPGQRVLVNRLSTKLGGDPEIGDVLVFHPPTGADGNGQECGVRRQADQACPEPTGEPSDQNFIKRVVAGPGDRLYIEDGQPVVNGEPLEEDYIRGCGGQPICNLPEEIVVPPDHWFMMGDNRGQSDDSRYWGPIDGDWIIGEAFFTYWPPRSIGLL
jgi:signal peptidase I